MVFTDFWIGVGAVLLIILLVAGISYLKAAGHCQWRTAGEVPREDVILLGDNVMLTNPSHSATGTDSNFRSFEDRVFIEHISGPDHRMVNESPRLVDVLQIPGQCDRPFLMSNAGSTSELDSSSSRRSSRFSYFTRELDELPSTRVHFRSPSDGSFTPPRADLDIPGSIGVPEEILSSPDSCKLFRKCIRLHDHLENLLELNIIPPEMCCQVTKECQRYGNISGLVLLYRLVRQSGKEMKFLSSLKANRERIPILSSSIGSDELSHISSSSSLSLPVSDVTLSEIGLTAGQQTLLWIRAMDQLEVLWSVDILTACQYCYIVDVAHQERRISALMQIIQGCNKLHRLLQMVGAPFPPELAQR